MRESVEQFEERIGNWRRQAERFRSLSRLFGEEGGVGPLAELARGIDEQIDNLNALRAGVIVQSLRTEVLVAELEMLMKQSRTLLYEARCTGASFTQDDVREESRLCVEEAAATYEVTKKRLVTEYAFALAQLAEEIGRMEEVPG